MAQNETYKMLQLYAKDIYANTRFDQNGNPGEANYKVNVEYKKKLSPLFRATMSKNLDLDYLDFKINQNNKGESAYKTIKIGNQEHTLIKDFISVSFDVGSSNEFERKYVEFSKVYVKDGIEIDNGELIANFNDSVYIKNDEIVAVKTGCKVKKVNELIKKGNIPNIVYNEEKNSYFYVDSKQYIYTTDDNLSFYELNEKMIDSVYANNNELVAIKVNSYIEKISSLVLESNYFKIDKYAGKDIYSYKKPSKKVMESDGFKEYKYRKLSPFNRQEILNAEIYVKRGLTIGYDELIKILDENDSIYVEDNNLLAVRINYKISNVNNLVKESKSFKYDAKMKCYKKVNTKYFKASSLDIRRELYDKGFKVEFIWPGEPEKKEIIKYSRYKRYASNARNGNCIFINDNYLQIMNSWTYLRISPNFNKDDKVASKMPVQLEAYKALSLSSLSNVIEIEPANILILKDKESVFTDECLCVDIDKDTEKLVINKKEDTLINNILWDGEGLLDKEVFDNNGYNGKGMLLLRNRYFKCCVFNTNLTEWFYRNNIKKPEDIKKLNGYTLAKKVEDIKLVFTESSMKFLKFTELDEENEKLIKKAILSRSSIGFGIVKTDKQTKYFDGKVYKTSYQFLNTLGVTNDEVKDFLDQNQDYLNKLKKYDEVLASYLDKEVNLNSFIPSVNSDINNTLEDKKDNSNEFNSYKYKICDKLLKINKDFKKTSIYSKFKTRILEKIKEEMKSGGVFIPGTYTTIFGNGFELLLNTIKHEYLNEEFKNNDIKNIKNLKLKPNEIMCKSFKNGEELCCARYPHITMGNLYRAKNKIVPEYDEWFNLSPEIVCVNAIHNNIQQRLNGMDYDSDAMLVTNYKPIIDVVDKHYDDFLVPVNIAKPGEPDDNIAEIDESLSKNLIGQIVNLSQRLNSILWHEYNETNKIDFELYKDICKLAILSNMEIDKAKRNYPVKTKDVMDEIKNNIDERFSKKPRFMGKITKKKHKNLEIDLDNDYMQYNTLMDYLDKYEFEKTGRGPNSLHLCDLINKRFVNESNGKVYGPKARKLEELLSDTYKNIDNITNRFTKPCKERNKLIDSEIDNLLVKLDDNKLLDNPYIIYILLNNYKKGRKSEELFWPLLAVLWHKVPKEKKNKKTGFKNMLEKLFTSDEPPSKLVRTDDSAEDAIELFGIKYKIE